MDKILFIGIIVSLIYTESTDLSPGGIIVPAYFALYIGDFRRMTLTLIVAVLCTFAVRALSQYIILYGRRRFAFYILTGIFIKLLLSQTVSSVPFTSIGYLIPGLLGKDLEKQGFFSTLVSLAIVTMLTWLIYLFYTEMIR